MRKFYQAMGFVASGPGEGVTFFQAGGSILALFGAKELAADAHLPAGAADGKRGFSRVSLAHNVRSEKAVDAVIAEAVKAGGKMLKPGQKVFWGGYSGYFADPEGNLWEVAHNPFFPLDQNGNITLP